jgi:hypothetical protein
LLNAHEVETLGEVARVREQLSPATLEWAARYFVTYQAARCTEMNLQVAYALAAAISAQDKADFYCDVSAGCDWAAEEAQRLAELESWRESEEAARREEAAAAQKVIDTVGAKGGFCLDGLGCVAVDGTKITVKTGGPFFAQLSFDAATNEVGVRAGVGFSDPTGGNLFGADLTIGGTVGPNGTSIDVRSSQNIGSSQNEVVPFLAAPRRDRTSP